MASFDAMFVGLYAVLCDVLIVLLFSWVSITPETDIAINHRDLM